MEGSIAYSLILLTTLTGTCTGIYSLYHGEWQKLPMKYAAVALSTVASFFLLLLYSSHPSMLLEHSDFSFDYAIGAISRNIAIVFFHLSCGKDAKCFNPELDRRQHNELRRLRFF